MAGGTDHFALGGAGKAERPLTFRRISVWGKCGSRPATDEVEAAPCGIWNAARLANCGSPC
jgi:hypothetical protein